MVGRGDWMKKLHIWVKIIIYIYIYKEIHKYIDQNITLCYAWIVNWGFVHKMSFKWVSFHSYSAIEIIVNSIIHVYTSNSWLYIVLIKKIHAMTNYIIYYNLKITK